MNLCAKFLSTPSARRATDFCGLLLLAWRISIHALREEGDLAKELDPYIERISIHALREEGDPVSCISRSILVNFYPRPPRGGRLLLFLDIISVPLFLSTPSARRATPVWFLTLTWNQEFLSTPSARRATPNGLDLCADPGISIHALREEGDLRAKQAALGALISIHALREEGDARCTVEVTVYRLFLSTPSARRATAKTETKSLFSNKLYNILHEFRRALIYNGSKSYPNHAK